MTRRDIINSAAVEFATHFIDTDETDFYGHSVKEEGLNRDEHRGFIAGAKWADNNPILPWINVKNDLPCNHKELLNAKYGTKEVFILKSGGFPDIDYMLKVDGKWIWFTNKSPEFWMPIPDLTEEED